MIEPEPVFALHIDARSVDVETRSWLDSLEKLPAADQLDALAKLRDALSEYQDADNLHVAAVGLTNLEDFDNAVLAFDRASAAAPDRPVNALNAAVVLVSSGQLRRARIRFRQVADLDHPLAATAQRYGQDVERLMEVAALDLELARLQVAEIEERMADGGVSRGQRVVLATKYVRLANAGHGDGDLARVKEICEALVEEDPDDTGALELLIAVYSAFDPDLKFDSAVAHLERIAPASDYLRRIDAVVVNPREPQVVLHADRASQRAALLAGLAQSDGPEREAALEGLREHVTRFPRNSEYRYRLMVSEAVNGNQQQAFKQACVLEALTPDSADHTQEFNLGVVFWLGGDQARSLAHFAQARKRATTERERLDVDEQLAGLGGVEHP